MPGAIFDYRHSHEQVYPDNSDDAYHRILAHSTTNSNASFGNIHLFLILISLSSRVRGVEGDW